MAPPRKTHCRRGHDLSKYGVQMFRPNGAKNGRDCSLCRKSPERMESDRESHRKKHWQDQFDKALEEVFGESTNKKEED